MVSDQVNSLPTMLQVHHVAQQGTDTARALARHRSSYSDPALQAIIDEIDRVDQGLTNVERSRVYRSILARQDAAAVSRADAAPGTLQFVRHLVHHPDVRDLFVVLPESVVGDAMYLPHLGVVLEPRPPGPIVIETCEQRTVLTWLDGSSLTVPCSMRELPERPLAGVRPLPHQHGWTVANGLGCQLPGAHDLGPIDDGALDPARHELAEGLDMLRTVWPQAAEAVETSIGGVLLLQRRSHARSHVLEASPSVVALTPAAPAQLADLLVHECAHIRLQSFERIDVLVEPGEQRFASPWRPDPRPIRGLLLGVHAFVEVAEWWRRVAGAVPDLAARAEQTSHRQTAKVQAAWRTLTAVASPTPLGEVVLESIGRRVHAL